MNKFWKYLVLAILSALAGGIGGRAMHSSAPVTLQPELAPAPASVSAPASVLEAKADALVASADALAKLVDAGLTPASAPSSQP